MKKLFAFFTIALFINQSIVFSQTNTPRSDETSNQAANTIEIYDNQVQVFSDKSHLPDDIRKNNECIDLVESAVKKISETSLEVACIAFKNINEWRRGEIFIFLLDLEGYILCHGDDSNLIWKNINSATNFVGEPIFDTIKKIDEKGIWVNYKWNNGYKSAYMKKITIDKNIYYIGAGYFPQSKEYIAEQLVRTAIDYAKQVPLQVAFTRISNPHDAFVIGDISIYVSDFQGNILASSLDLAFTGQNFINLQDIKGTFVIKEIINKLKKSNLPFWFNAYWLGDFQKNYVKPYFDAKLNKNYFFVANYRPNINENYALELLYKAQKHIDQVGLTKALADFSNPLSEFNKGGIHIYAYDFQGKCLANGEFPVLVGQNLIERKDKNDKLIVKEIIRVAETKGQGITLTSNKNSTQKLLVKSIKSPHGNVILVTGVYVQNKPLTVRLFVEKALIHLKQNTLVDSMRAFSNPSDDFCFGDISIFIYNSEGIALVNGDQRSGSWQDNSKFKGERGQRVIADLIKLAKQGGGWYQYSLRNGIRRVFVHPFYIVNKDTKDKETFIIGSGYFL